LLARDLFTAQTLKKPFDVRNTGNKSACMVLFLLVHIFPDQITMGIKTPSESAQGNRLSGIITQDE